jgi:hypothetical protein
MTESANPFSAAIWSRRSPICCVRSSRSRETTGRVLSCSQRRPHERRATQEPDREREEDCDIVTSVGNEITAVFSDRTATTERSPAEIAQPQRRRDHDDGGDRHELRTRRKRRGRIRGE